MWSQDDEKPSLTKVNDDVIINSTGRKRGVVFIILVFVVFMQLGLHAGRDPRTSTSNTAHNSRGDEVLSVIESSTTLSKSNGGGVTGHPIPRLMAEAEDKFRALLSKQSKSLSAAVKEYKRRYGRNPPKGFDDWYNFCLEHKVLMIDEYDALVEDLEPFWNMSTVELRRRTEQVHLPIFSYMFQF